MNFYNLPKPPASGFGREYSLTDIRLRIEFESFYVALLTDTGKHHLAKCHENARDMYSVFLESLNPEEYCKRCI